MHRIAFIYLINDSARQKRPPAGQPGHEAAAAIYRLIALASDATAALVRGLHRVGRVVSGLPRAAQARVTTPGL